MTWVALLVQLGLFLTGESAVKRMSSVAADLTLYVESSSNVSLK